MTDISGTTEDGTEVTTEETFFIDNEVKQSSLIAYAVIGKFA